MGDSSQIIKRFEQLQSLRYEWEGDWQMCTDYVLPRLGSKYGQNRTNYHIFDSTAPLALERCAAAFESVLAPRTVKWHTLTTGNFDLDADPDVARWLESVTDILFQQRYNASANFANQFIEALLSLCCLGTAVIYTDERPGIGLRYQCIPLHQVYLAEDSQGKIDSVFRSYKLTARQAIQEFGDKTPDNIKRSAEDHVRCEDTYDFIHGVFPRGDVGSGKSRMPISSVHIERQSRTVVRESGYSSMPYAVSRFNVTPGDIYGRSPAMSVMPDILQVNAMKKTVLRAAERIVSPPLLAQDDDVLNSFSLEAGYVNFGGLDYEGRARIQPFSTGGNIPIGLDLINQAREAINEAFYLNLFQVLVETSGTQTATEVLERAQERAQLLAPVMGRQQSELLETIIYREVDILSKAGAFPPLPEILQTSGAQIMPRYETAMSQALSGQEGQSTLNALNAAANLAQFDQNVPAMINVPLTLQTLWSSFGAPLKLLKSGGEIEEMQQAAQEQAAQQAQMQEAQAMLGGLEQAAGAEEKLARANQMGGSGLEGLAIEE